jgi:hypothetical protein
VLYLGRRRAWRQAILLLMPAGLLLGGLIIHNQIRFGYPNLTYLLGHHLGTRTVALYDQIADPQVRDIMVSTRNSAYVHRNPYWTTWYTRRELMRVKQMGAVALAQYMQTIHLRLIRAHPLAYVDEVARAFCNFWSPDLPEQANRLAAVRSASMAAQVLLCAAFWMTVVLWTGLGMGRLFLPIPQWLPDRRVRFLFAAAIAAIFYTALLSSALDIGEPRYRGPVDLLLLFVLAMASHFLAQARTRPSEQ